MSYTLYITYKLPLIDAANEVPQVSPVFDLSEGNYSSDKSYTEANGNTVWSTKVINDNDITSTRQVAQSVKSVYATSGLNYDPYDPEVYAHSDTASPVPLYRFAKEIFPIATYNSDTDTYSAELVIETPESNPFNKDDVDATISYYTNLAKAVPNIVVISDIVSFTRYGASVGQYAAISPSLYIPQGDDTLYFADLDNSVEINPSPPTLNNVTIDDTQGKVYEAQSLNNSTYVAKTDNIIIAYSKDINNPPIMFIYKDVVFKSTGNAVALPDSIIGIPNDGGGAWTCAEDSIIIYKDEIFIGNNVSTPTA